MDQSGTLVFLLFLPLLWIVWLAMIISKPAIIFHISQTFFNFLAMACFASVASFQAKWGIGPSGLSGFAIFVSVTGIFLSLFLLFVPVVYEKYDKLIRLARTLKEVRVGFILVGSGCIFSLLIAFITTISAWTEPGCKNADNDPHASLGDAFTSALPGWCSTKKAGAIFFWLAFGFWLASFILLIIDWRSGNLTSPPRDLPFTRPHSDIEEGEEVEAADTHTNPSPPTQHPHTPANQQYDNSNASASPFADSNRLSAAPTNTNTTYLPSINTNRFSTADSSANRTSAYSTAPTTTTAPTTSTNTGYATSRPSMDAYGAFSDPAPSGFGGVSASYAPTASDSGSGAPKVSRTMQYADPYAAVRASLATSTATGAPAPTKPSYEPYTGYR
ncbi:uncharacterized protein F5891DRAFT_1126119 [Suillus fuscotomentosus]|uniref:MARVEL domain-containing protein n=1 Tax=Suillus fuscotomentosus TaxID=1912939 RepID=A0AAD4HQR5_9AGAM|nr:uncharacterized protein F5891DRAFT_1126119 [Suillus fuscotomentosus]KAG1905337.1 hypothetical protein F5891DRAFT_1126119 [Suillus fuscotomentosus]